MNRAFARCRRKLALTGTQMFRCQRASLAVVLGHCFNDFNRFFVFALAEQIFWRLVKVENNKPSDELLSKRKILRDVP